MTRRRQHELSDVSPGEEDLHGRLKLYLFGIRPIYVMSQTRLPIGFIMSPWMWLDMCAICFCRARGKQLRVLNYGPSSTAKCVQDVYHQDSGRWLPLDTLS